MKCQKCKQDFPEKDIQESHDVPKYICENKAEADAFGRHHLCKKCHDIYERICFSAMSKYLPENIKAKMKIQAKAFAKSFFKEARNGQE